MLSCLILLSQVLYGRSNDNYVSKYAVVIVVIPTNPTCNKNNGKINIQITSGLAPFTFTITGFLPQSYGIFTNLAPGSYTITVTDANAESVTQTVTLTNIFTAPGASAMITSLPTGCFSNNASVTLTASEGLAPYLFSIDHINYQSGNIFTGLTAGSYRYVVKDANGCESFVGPFNNLLIPVNCPIKQNGITLSYTCNPFRCYLGLINVSGGTPPYTYSLDGITYQTNDHWVNGVPEGLYTIWVKDAAGLILLFSVAVKDHCISAFNVSTVVQPAQCGINGSITVTAIDGTSPYQYSIDGITFQSNNSFTGLAPGNYTITVKDANNITGSKFVILGNSCLTVNLTSNASSCGNNNGGIQATASNGTAPYQYSIDGINFTPGGNFTGLLAGNYTITVKDVINNTSTAAVTIANTDGPIINLVVTSPAECINQTGTITISAQGGTPPLKYSINGGTFTNNPFFSGLGAGAYNLTIKDANECTLLSSVTIPLTNTLHVDAGNDALVCEGESITLNGSSNGQSFLWTNSTTLSNADIYNPVAKPVVSTMYYLNATSGSCTKNDSVFVQVKPSPLTNAGASQTICFGQNANLQGSGGISFLWTPSSYLSNPNIFNPQVVKPLNSIIYKLTVTGANGCKSVQPGTVTINVTPPPKVFAGNDTSIVIGQALQLDAKDINGSGFNQYTWSPATGINNPFIQTPVAIIKSNIKYVVFARTQAGCEGIDSISINAFTHSDIFVPTAFTPNSDGKNDILKAIPVGIKLFKYFAVYDRYGSKIFYTDNANIGWDGKTKNSLYNTSGFIWIAAGIDYNNNEIIRKGNVLLIH